MFLAAPMPPNLAAGPIIYRETGIAVQSTLAAAAWAFAH